jgi:Flp pilus assembly protein TadB
LSLAVVTALVAPRLLARAPKVGGRSEPQPSPALAADLVVAALAAGVPLVLAVDAAGAAVGGSVGRSLQDVRRMAQVGADPLAAVGSLADDVATARLARAVARAAQSGMSPAEVLAAAADAERARRRSARVAKARGAGSLAAAPVGLMFLPAFVLVAVVPLVVGSLSVLQPGG